MSETAQKIMEVFKEYKINRNELLMENNLYNKSLEWEPNHKNNLSEALKELEDIQFVEKGNNGYLLLENGFNHNYK